MGYIKFIEDKRFGRRHKTKRIVIKNSNGVLLGHIAWKTTWRTYVFWPERFTYYSYGCLKGIAAKVHVMNEAWYKKIIERNSGGVGSLSSAIRSMKKIMRKG